MPYEKVSKDEVLRVKKAVRAIIVKGGVRNYIVKGAIELELRLKNITLPGHDQYFYRVIHDGIIRARFTDKKGTWKYVPWSNIRNGSRSRSYKKVRA